MPAVVTDPQLLLAAFLRMVRRLHGTTAARVEWLAALQQQALIGSASGIAEVLANLQDHSTSAVTSEGSTTQWLREMSAPTIATLCEAAIQVIEADEAAGGVGMAASGQSRGFDFSARPLAMG